MKESNLKGKKFLILMYFADFKLFFLLLMVMKAVLKKDFVGMMNEINNVHEYVCDDSHTFHLIRCEQNHFGCALCIYSYYVTCAKSCTE